MSANIKLIEEKILKRILYMKYKGICGIGSEGNVDANYILSGCKENIVHNKEIQGLILDFSEIDYEFGNGFGWIFLPTEKFFNKKILISIILNIFSLKHWKSLVNHMNIKIDFIGNETSICHNNIDSALKSINKRFNMKG